MSHNTGEHPRSVSNNNDDLSDRLQNLAVSTVPESSENPPSQSNQEPLLVNNAADRRRLVMKQVVATSEDSNEYTDGGYCTVDIGTACYNNKYEIVKKLGWGSYATVYMAKNREEDTYVALKFIKSAVSYFDSSMKEIQYHATIQQQRRRKAKGAKYVSTFLESFMHRGPNGQQHHVLAFDLLGPSLYDVVHASEIDMFHTEKARQLCRQLLQAVHFLHDKCGIIHCDIKTNNILVKISDEDIKALDPNSATYNPTTTSYDLDFGNPQSDIRIKLCDFGASVTMANNRNHRIQTSLCRAPEVFLGCTFDKSADMWGVGCVLYTLVTGRNLFHCLGGQDPSYDRAFHLSQMQELFGPITRETFESAHNSQLLNECFGSNGLLTIGNTYRPQALKDNLIRKDCIARQHVDQFVDFLKSLLALDPKKRPTAKRALAHRFLLPNGGIDPAAQ
ncbi:unnamed protein product [Caenorhabditis brenneri]